MKNYVKVEVTQELIVKGQSYEPSFCPVALALQGVLNRPGLSVSVEDVYLGEYDYDLRGQKRFALAREISDWIEDYDAAPWTARPITFLVHKRFVRR